MENTRRVVGSVTAIFPELIIQEEAKPIALRLRRITEGPKEAPRRGSGSIRVGRLVIPDGRAQVSPGEGEEGYQNHFIISVRNDGK